MSKCNLPIFIDSDRFEQICGVYRPGNPLCPALEKFCSTVALYAQDANGLGFKAYGIGPSASTLLFQVSAQGEKFAYVGIPKLSEGVSGVPVFTSDTPGFDEKNCTKCCYLVANAARMDKKLLSTLLAPNKSLAEMPMVLSDEESSAIAKHCELLKLRSAEYYSIISDIMKWACSFVDGKLENLRFFELSTDKKFGIGLEPAVGESLHDAAIRLFTGMTPESVVSGTEWTQGENIAGKGLKQAAAEIWKPESQTVATFAEYVAIPTDPDGCFEVLEPLQRQMGGPL